MSDLMAIINHITILIINDKLTSTCSSGTYPACLGYMIKQIQSNTPHTHPLLHSIGFIRHVHLRFFSGKYEVLHLVHSHALICTSVVQFKCFSKLSKIIRSFFNCFPENFQLFTFILIRFHISFTLGGGEFECFRYNG